MSFHLEQLIGVDRTSNVLEDVILKIRVNQETEGGKEWARFGAVQLNLSEYAGSRETTRKFLLEQSKTNAALSVTVFSVLKSGGAPSFKVPESAKKFVRLEDEDEEGGGEGGSGGGGSGGGAGGGGKEGYRAHNMQETLISDQRYMVRERENMVLPPHIVATRENNTQLVEDLLARVFHGIDI